MRGGAGRGGDPLALQVLERLDALVGAHPELRGRDLDVVDQKHLALSARGEIREHGAGREHVEAAADQGLEDFEAGVELAQFQIEALLCRTCRGPCRSRSGRRPRPYADSRRGPWSWPARSPARGRQSRRAAMPAVVVRNCRRSMVYLLLLFFDYSENEAGRICACCARYSLITSSRMWLRSSPNSGRSCNIHRADRRRARR